MKHAYVRSEEGLQTGTLGWILQQSPSYKSNYFKFRCVYSKEHKRWMKQRHVDPWDNHSLNPNHWSHAYIESIENINENYEWIDSFVDTFKERTVFGLSYGGWTKSLPWDNKNVDLICVESNDKTVELFIDTYLKRTMTPEEVEESLNMHIHDHHQDDEDYRKHIYNIVGEKAIKYAQDNQQIEFWQLQYCFHHGGDRLLEKDEIDIMKKKYYNTIMEAQSFTTLNHDRIKYYDIFNLDLKKISEDLNIEYVDKMQQEYNVFIDFSDMVFNDRQF